ncbi:MAG: AAA family ATPase [Polyangiaceae bacterium]|nr:AAA family ATPase [Polyangiaceae bacterium]
MASQIQALLLGGLDVGAEPAKLFDLDLKDEEAVDLEVRRLRALLTGASLEPGTVGSVASASPPGSNAPLRARPVGSARAPALGGPAPSASALPVLGAASEASRARYPDLPPELWAARLELDSARLRFLELPRSRRDALLETHRRRQGEAEGASRASAQRLSEAESEVLSAETAQRQALEEARRARSEAKRLLSEEQARLLGVSADQARFEAELIRARQRSDERADLALGWQRRVRELQEQRGLGQAAPPAADALYDDLRSALRGLRSELANALSTVTRPSTVPQPGRNPLGDLPAEIDLADINRLRAEVAARAVVLTDRERQEQWERASRLQRQVEAMNDLRVELYPLLSSERRSALRGFGLSGWDQARSEARQLGLVARYHALAARNWLRQLSRVGLASAEVVFALVDVAKAVGTLLLAGWLLRHASGPLRRWREQLEGGVAGGPVRRRRLHWLTGVALRIRLPLGWLLAWQLAAALLSSALRSQLEVRLLLTIVAWVLGGTLVVNILDVVAGARAFPDIDPSPVDRLRLRTLRLVGRVVVPVGLTLALSVQLVGRGTIYAWVLTTCWLLFIPVVIVVLRWWQEVIFERLGDRRGSNALSKWVVGRRGTWGVPVALAIGGAYLLGRGVARGARRYLGGFDLTRRILAFLFRRELAKQSRIQGLAQSLASPPLDIAKAFDPESPPVSLLVSAADTDLGRVSDVIRAPRGGVFAVVGERGSGKTTLLERLVALHPEARSVSCPFGGWPRLLRELRAQFELPANADEDALARAISGAGFDVAVLIDNVHRLARLTVGGLDDLDRLFALARRTSDNCAWIFSFERSLFRFVKASRGAVPLFDQVLELQPWSEEQIAELIEHRCALSGVEPSFERLVVTPAEDEFELAEQVRRTRASYYRLLWDYSRGNPAVALQFWSQSLGVDAGGKLHVKLFTPPTLDDLEALPDDAAFVLHALVQLEPARREDLVAATRLAPTVVDDALRFSRVRGHVELHGGRYRVAWPWFRSTTRLLERRHLGEA